MPKLIDLKKNAINAFIALARDKELAQLLEIPSSEMKDIKKQIIEDRFPSDLIEENSSRICVYEKTSYRPTFNSMMERGWLMIDIYVYKDKHSIDRRALLIAERVIDVLDDRQRLLRGLKHVGLGTGLRYHSRTPDMFSNQSDWVQYGLIFTYDYIL